MFPLS